MVLFLEYGDVIEVGWVNKFGFLSFESMVLSFVVIMNININLEGCFVG